MARPTKKGVDYFSHDTDAASSKTLEIIEEQFSNDGYAFWFKLLERLGKQDGLYYDCSKVADWKHLCAKAKVSEETATEILDLLASLDAIDAELWQEKIIWVQNFVDRLADVWKKRKEETPQKPSLRSGNPTSNAVSDAESTQSKVKESKVKESKVINTRLRAGRFASFWSVYPKKRAKPDAEKAFNSLDPDDALLAVMIGAVEAQSRSPDWTKDGGNFIPYPATWIRKRRWEDEDGGERLPKVREGTYSEVI